MKETLQNLSEGENLFFAGKVDQARQWFLNYLEHNSAEPEAWNNLGVIAYSCDQFDEAERCLKKALELDNKNRKTLDNIANVNATKNNLMRYSPPQLNRPGRSPVTLSRSRLAEVLKHTCYFPHPEARMGKLAINPEVFADKDRETNISVSPRARLDLTGDIAIGAWTMIGEGTQLLTHDHLHIGRNKPLLQLQEERGIQWADKTIGKDVWLHGCTVLFQVEVIPDGVVVGAGSVLTKTPKPYEIWAGNPARKVGER